MLRCVAVRAVFEALPAAQMCGGAMQQVAVAGREQLTHQHDEGVDPHHDQVLTGPAHVVVLCFLQTRRDRQAECAFINKQFNFNMSKQGWLLSVRFPFGDRADLDEAER